MTELRVGQVVVAGKLHKLPVGTVCKRENGEAEWLVRENDVQCIKQSGGYVRGEKHPKKNYFYSPFTILALPAPKSAPEQSIPPSPDAGETDLAGGSGDAATRKDAASEPSERRIG